MITSIDEEKGLMEIEVAGEIISGDYTRYWKSPGYGSIERDHYTSFEAPDGRIFTRIEYHDGEISNWKLAI